MQTTSGGAAQETCPSNPFGDGLSCTGGSDATEQHFTGKDRDVESGLDYFGARYYSSNLGRFMTPDWSGAPTTVPYANFGDPQSLNLYAYVGNNPMTGIDADGHMDNDSDTPSYPNSGAYAQIDSAEGNWEAASSELAEAGDAWASTGSAYDPSGYAAPGALAPPPTPQGDSGSAQQKNTDYVSVSYWWTGAGGFGHIGVGVDTDNTQGFSTKNPALHWWQRLFGAPAARTEFDIPQHTKNGEVAPHSNIHIPISADQAAAMRTAIADRTANAGHYNLLFNNCAGFVESVLHAGGVSGVPHAEVFGPMVLGAILGYEDSF